MCVCMYVCIYVCMYVFHIAFNVRKPSICLSELCFITLSEGYLNKIYFFR